jgi:hypothetical protein
VCEADKSRRFESKLVEAMTVDSHAEDFIANGHQKWNNDYSSHARKAKPSAVTVLSDVVTDDACEGGALLALGSVLDAVDLCAGRAAFHHVEGPVRQSRPSTPEE